MIGTIRQAEREARTGLLRQTFASWLSPSSYKPEWHEGDVRSQGCNAPLQGLAGSSLAERFRCWQGQSGRRYIFSVFSLDDYAARDEFFPAEGQAVVIAAERRKGVVLPLWIAETGASPQAFFHSERIWALALRGGCELHLHLLARDAGERQAIIGDLRGVTRN